MKRIKVDFQELVNNNAPYPLFMQFDIFQWMMKTGWEFRDRHGVYELLYGMSGHGAQYYNHDDGFDLPSLTGAYQFLKAAFVRAIVATDVSKDVLRWRETERIGLGRYRMLLLPVSSRRPYETPICTLYRLNRFQERPLTAQLNEVYEKATAVNRIKLSPNREGWMPILHYGYPDEKFGSYWSHDLLEKRSVSFYDALERAISAMEELTKVIKSNE